MILRDNKFLYAIEIFRDITGQWIMDYGLRIMDYELWIMVYGLGTMDNS